MPSRFKHFVPAYLETKETLQFCDDFRNELKTEVSEDPFFLGFVPVMEESSSNIVALEKREMGSEYTSEVKASDKRRGSLYRSVISNLKDDVKFIDVDPEAGSAAKQVLSVINAHLVETNGSYAVESQGYKQVFSELDKIPNVVASCSAARRISALRSEQVQFDIWRQKQSDDRDSQLRGALEDAEQDLWLKLDIALSHLEGQAMINPTQYESLAKHMEDHITRIMAPARARNTKQESTVSEA